MNVPAFFNIILGVILLLGPGGQARAEFPDRAVHIVAAFAAGGSTDTATRVIAEDLSNRLRVPVVVENKVGAGGMIAAGAVSRADPDGYTVLFTVDSIVINQALAKNPSFDVTRDLVPITTAVEAYYGLAVNPSVPAMTVGELVDYAKANPGKLRFGSAGLGTPSHLRFEQFKHLAKIDVVHVPYVGGAPMIMGGVKNEVQITFADPFFTWPQVEAGSLRMLAFTGKERSSALPGIPTFVDSGYPGFSPTYWAGYFAPPRIA